VTDLYIRIREQPRDVLDTIAKSLNVRASEPAMQTICSRYMGQIALYGGARVLEIGCGNGATTKLIMEYVSPAQLVGIDRDAMHRQDRRERDQTAIGLVFESRLVVARIQCVTAPSRVRIKRYHATTLVDAMGYAIKTEIDELRSTCSVWTQMLSAADAA